MCIIDLLEVIKIHHHQSTCPARSKAALDFSGQNCMKKSGINQACHPVVHGQVAQIVDNALYLCIGIVGEQSRVRFAGILQNAKGFGQI
jgi:hypothetical protein